MDWGFNSYFLDYKPRTLGTLNTRSCPHELPQVKVYQCQTKKGEKEYLKRYSVRLFACVVNSIVCLKKNSNNVQVFCNRLPKDCHYTSLSLLSTMIRFMMALTHAVSHPHRKLWTHTNCCGAIIQVLAWLSRAIQGCGFSQWHLHMARKIQNQAEYSKCFKCLFFGFIIHQADFLFNLKTFLTVLLS